MENIIDALSSAALSELGISSVDRVILSLPPCVEDQLTLENMKPVWQVRTSSVCTRLLIITDYYYSAINQHMEQLAKDRLTKVIGVADLNKAQLQELFDWATVSFDNCISTCLPM